MKLSDDQIEGLNIRLKNLEKKNECKTVQETLRILLEKNTGEDKIKNAIEKLEEKTKAQGVFEDESETISAISLLGFCYKEGLGVTKNLNRALELLQQAAKRGDAISQNELGICYAIGLGVEKDLKQAIELVRSAEEQGLAAAQRNLGCCYEYGEGVEKDLRQAAEHFRKAAVQGNVDAQFRLGLCYENGQGVEKNLEQATEWFKKAVAQGCTSAQFHIKRCYRAGFEDIERELKTVIEWYRVQNSLGLCYPNDLSVEFDNLKEMIVRIQQGSLQQKAYAQYLLGTCYLNGVGVIRDLTRAVLLLKMASSKGIEEARPLLLDDLSSQVPPLEEVYDHYLYKHPILGFCYQFGLGVEQDLIKACEHYIQAIDQFEEIVKTQEPEVIAQHFSCHIYKDLFFIYRERQIKNIYRPERKKQNIPPSKEEYEKFYKGLEALEKNEKLSLSIKKQLVLCLAEMYERRGPSQNLIKAGDYYLKHEKYSNAADVKTDSERKITAETSSADINNYDWVKRKQEKYKNLPAYQQHIEKICGEIAAFPNSISSIVTEYAFFDPDEDSTFDDLDRCTIS